MLAFFEEHEEQNGGERNARGPAADGKDQDGLGRNGLSPVHRLRVGIRFRLGVGVGVRFRLRLWLWLGIWFGIGVRLRLRFGVGLRGKKDLNRRFRHAEIGGVRADIQRLGKERTLPAERKRAVFPRPIFGKR